jgi:hypothetical protein
MNKVETLQKLISGQTVSLASWLAEPVSQQRAQACLPGILHRLQASISSGHGSFPVRLAEVVVRYWCGHDLDAIFRNLLALHGKRREQAQLKLCYGELLMACKYQPAWDYLDSGFELAAHLFEPEEYFLVLKRHELLRRLQLRPVPAKPASLDELLTEARVIQRLNGRANYSPPQKTGHLDTLD